MITFQHPEPWNKGKLIGQKFPLKLRDVSKMFFNKQFIQLCCYA
jgi:hypothetical protein